VRRKDVLNLISVAINVIGSDIGLLDEIELPQSMGSHDASGFGLSFTCEDVASGALCNEPE
jgi:hypothetical protein